MALIILETKQSFHSFETRELKRKEEQADASSYGSREGSVWQRREVDEEGGEKEGVGEDGEERKKERKLSKDKEGLSMAL